MILTGPLGRIGTENLVCFHYLGKLDKHIHQAAKKGIMT